MKLTRALCNLTLFMLCTFARAQYSPYYFHDTLKDNGVESQEHLDNLGKVFMDVYSDRHNPVYQDGIPLAGAKSGVDAKIYLKRSLKYYYTKYSLDTTLKNSDWDFRKYKPKVKIPDNWSKGGTLGFMVCVLLCDGDTVSSWRQLAWWDDFHKSTQFSIRIWRSEHNQMTDDEYSYPLFEYVRKNKLTGKHEISLFVYAGKIQCNSVADRGPEVLADGKFILNISDNDLKEMQAVKGKAKKLVFPSYEWGTKVIKLEKTR